MVFSSPVFIFIFLPLVLFFIGIARKNLHNIILLIASLIFYSWGSLSQTPIFLFSIVLNYFFGLFINNAEGKKAKAILSLAVTINLLLLGYFKYFNFFLDNINSLIGLTGGTEIKYEPVTLPIGISFFTFHALSYVIDVYRKKVTAQKNILDLALYISFFPQLIAGPIVRYIDVADQFRSRVVTLENISNGAQRFIFGLAKKLIVANTVALIADQVFALPTNQVSGSLAWLGILCYTLQIYFDFSGYSDMALGLARMFGFHFPENFNYPYIADSIKDFWRRWHISLSTWFRDFLYIPLGGNRGSEAKTLRNLLIVFLCTGFWHGASWTFVIWGLFHGAFLLLERIGLEKVLLKTWKPVRIAYTLLVVMVGWVFFRADTYHIALNYVGRMFHLSSDNTVQFYAIEFLNSKVLSILIFAILYSFRVFRWITERFAALAENKNRTNVYLVCFQGCKVVFSMVLLTIAIGYLASSTYNPFIYFRF
jgi:alginate O-acetyltransferase complex protein AlgI